MGALLVIVPTLFFAALCHPGLNKDFLSDTTWTYAMYLESFAILPQLFLFQKQSKANATVDYLIGHFVASLGVSRLDLRTRSSRTAGHEVTVAAPRVGGVRRGRGGGHWRSALVRSALTVRGSDIT